MYEMYLAIVVFMEQGGNVLYLIAILTFVMWTMLIERILYFVMEHRKVVADAMDAWESRDERRSWGASAVREKLISEATSKINGTFNLIVTCVALSPLLGLLGTVTGMIAVFEAMATQGGNARSMAAGVSMATIPTMAGMVVSLSGVFASTFLKQKIDYEVELFQDHLTMDH